MSIGPTYIAIRSGKHSSSTTFSHALDFEKLLTLKEFEVITRSDIDRVVKPIFNFPVNGTILMLYLSLPMLQEEALSIELREKWRHSVRNLLD